MSNLIVSQNFEPLPPPSVLAELKKIDPRLGLKFTPGAEGFFAITLDWKANDPRREWVQQGLTPPDMAYDIESYIPQNLDAHDVPGYVAERWGRNRGPNTNELLAKLAETRKAEEDAPFKPVVDEALNEIEVKGGNLFAGMGKSVVKVGPASKQRAKHTRST